MTRKQQKYVKLVKFTEGNFEACQAIVGFVVDIQLNKPCIQTKMFFISVENQNIFFVKCVLIEKKKNMMNQKTLQLPCWGS